jgi:hypothetical protein
MCTARVVLPIPGLPATAEMTTACAGSPTPSPASSPRMLATSSSRPVKSVTDGGSRLGTVGSGATSGATPRAAASSWSRWAPVNCRASASRRTVSG